MGRPPLLRVALAAVVLATALAPLASTAQVPPPRCADERSRTRPDGWIQLARPGWSAGSQQVRSWAAARSIDGYLLVTNGTAVARSTDAGCSWEEVFTPGVGTGELRIQSAESIYGVALPPSPPGRLGFLSYAVISDFAGTRVATSPDLGETWTEQPSVGLPQLSALHAVHVAADPRIAYVLADSETTLASLVETTLYVTRDGGLTFAPVQRGLIPSQYTKLAVDPSIPSHVWAWDQEALYRSTDSGATFTKVTVPGRVGTVDIAHFPAYAPAKVTAYRADRSSATVSTDGGATWREVPTRGRVTGAANLHQFGAAVATASSAGVYVDVPSLQIKERNVSPSRIVLRELAWSYAPNQLSLYGNTATDLYALRLSPRFDPPKPPPPLKLRTGKVLAQGPTTFRPLDHVVNLKPGEPQTIEYELDLAPIPTPLDIFFATDSTGSMSPVIDSLRSDLQDIIDDLADSGIDVWFGVGDFKDYPHFGSPTDHPYKRFRAVGPIDDELSEAIAAIRIGGGNGLDSALTATYQAATGEGQRRIGVADAGGWWVEPGKGAQWRDDALKVLVIAADVRTREPSTDPGYPGPTFKQTIEKLNFLGIEHVGLAVGNSPAQPYQSLARVSRGTGTVAPEGGTDCDDNGRVDIQPGEPLVCELPLRSTAKNGTNLTPAMVGLMKSLQDLQEVSFRISGDPRVAQPLGDTVVRDVNVKDQNLLSFTVEATCDATTAGSRYRYGVEVAVGARTVAATGLTVNCGALPKVRRVPPPRDFPPPAVRAVAAVAVPPPPPPPAPIPQTQVNTNPNPNPNPNPQVVTQAGMVHQEQTQVALALAHAEMQIEEELATSSLRDGDAARATVVLCAGMVMTAGAAVALRRRTREVPVRVRSSG